MEKIKYPIGKYNPPKPITEHHIEQWIHELENYPARLREKVSGLDEDQLDTPYREDGWTVLQLVHHIVDSHLNAYIRTKLTLTEDTPTIKPYFQDRWAELPDSFDTPVETSIRMLESLHKRWTILLKSLSNDHFDRSLYHPEDEMEMTLGYLIGMYAWHGSHHLAHVNNLIKASNW
jgi:hypothetical protein